MRVIFAVIEENQLSYSYTESTHIQKQKPVTEQVNRSFQRINQKSWQTHSTVLAWRIPGMGETGGLPSMGSHRVRHD